MVYYDTEEKCDDDACYCNRECCEDFDKDDDWELEFTDMERRAVIQAIIGSMLIASLLAYFTQ